MQVKTCVRCNTEQPLALFSVNKRAADGLSSWCKDCYRAYNAARRAANLEALREQDRLAQAARRAADPEGYREYQRQRREADPEKYRQLNREWHEQNPGQHEARNREWRKANAERYQSSLDQYRREHAEEMKQKRREWAAANPELHSAKIRRQRHAREARRREALIAGPVPAAAYAAIMASGPCVYCGKPAVHADHVLALSRGGWEHESNLVPACENCNCSKRQRLLTEWDPVRVAHGVAHSEKVAAEWQRLTVSQTA